MTRILGIETSCDETGIAIVENGRKILADIVASQTALHAQFGGVVPELASRQHIITIAELTARALEKCENKVDAVACTQGPGLMGSLLVGVNFGKAFAYARNLPFIPVHHIEGHLFAAFLEHPDNTTGTPQYPFLALVVSGGHTCLITCPEPHQYTILGTTRDDAVGECFDKVARLLGLPYPGGPAIQRAALNGDPHAFEFPRAMSKRNSLEFSYSGLKTAVLYTLRDLGNNAQENPSTLANLAASFQYAAIDILVEKTKLALTLTGFKRLVVAGGVAANQLLRSRLTNELDCPVHIPPLPLCMDNGAMIAAAAYSRLQHGFSGNLSATADSSLPLT
ncbi:MAG TPA: tRNA (adenosine(37)-N6)-threonylcarbamoyltransferase complex transferase subunit TsaD [Candidatus Hydrogenedentes bacterium]|nr:tRNA (adenosine(37)-N6)-threonylcarbamoyltransferase complex transferase subunit TsaD [Candidatus Hydrogenedentota bacterium]HOL76531.1 tRNA (adenosine(37)-N6)-threonylcarbamoyltransferase complex transferase subunit TsaD [Candidatus Hydrogenedentota bacterium]HPO85195.1 tRNA (adenosine(37)-N6)-threonylcarbamoyltransferase complex transferase subunit TsaD [Candidatus Hydrogenedentota bacterium]